MPASVISTSALAAVTVEASGPRLARHGQRPTRTAFDRAGRRFSLSSGETIRIAVGANEPTVVLPNPDSAVGHPELEHGFEGKPVIPVTCQHCGFVATYSIQNLKNVSPWE
jgi:hypothetical protein